MLQITIPDREYYNEISNEFIFVNGKTITLEHSLLSISKWESKWKKPFCGTEEKTYEETIDYIRCMTITNNVDPRLYNNITFDNLKQVKEYIEDSMTATVISDGPKKKSSSYVTSELVYFWMASFRIPFTCEKWNFNRLLTLIRICEIKNSPKKKMSKRERLSKNKALNEARRRKSNTSG